MNQQQAIDKAIKLLRLAKSSNRNEAAAAAARAQEIIDRHRLDVRSIEQQTENFSGSEPIIDWNGDPIIRSKRLVLWKGKLLVGLCKVNSCVAYVAGGCGDLCVIGRPSDAAVVRALFPHLVREIDRLAKQDCAGMDRSFTSSFRVGCAETICDRLRDQHEQTKKDVTHEAYERGENALVVVTNAITRREKEHEEVREFARETHTWRPLNTSQGQHYSGRMAGRMAGHRANLHSGSLTHTKSLRG